MAKKYGPWFDVREACQTASHEYGVEESLKKNTDECCFEKKRGWKKERDGDGDIIGEKDETEKKV